MEPIKKELVSLRIPKKLNEKLANYVATIGISKTAFILQLINEKLEKISSIGKTSEHLDS